MTNEKPENTNLAKISPEYILLSGQVATLSTELTALRGFIYTMRTKCPSPSPDTEFIISHLEQWAKLTEEFNRPINFTRD